MINFLKIKNFAIIENTEVQFDEGLNIITGETGAGKSIVIEAVSMALGARADSGLVRTGTDKAVIQLSGELDGEEMVITREISGQGKSYCKINGDIVSLQELKKIAGRMADIHGQYDNQSLLDPDYHITLLDCYKSDNTAELKASVSSLFEEYQDARSALIKLLSLEKENARKKDFYSFEIAEIDKADLTAGEDTELEDRVSVLQNAEKIYENVERAYSILQNESPSALDALSTAMNSIRDIAGYSRELESISSEFADCYYRLEEISNNIRNTKESITFSPDELDRSISRLNLIDDLKKKYGNTIGEILEYRDRIASELHIVENFDEEKVRLEKDLISAKKKLLSECEKLTEARKEVALELQGRIRDELRDLNFKDADLVISIEPLDAPSENGMDKVEFLISTNLGEPLKPLYKIASGGEMSRIMLAFKNIISGYDKIPTLIFDEIDNGISGITASIVAKKLKEISKEHQIICITHLPQIAAAGMHNYRIYKESDDSSTYTNVEHLDDKEKIEEIARLLGGTNITETTLRSAAELIENS